MHPTTRKAASSQPRNNISSISTLCQLKAPYHSNKRSYLSTKFEAVSPKRYHTNLSVISAISTNQIHFFYAGCSSSPHKATQKRLGVTGRVYFSETFSSNISCQLSDSATGFPHKHNTS